MKHKNYVKFNIGRKDLSCHIDAVHAQNPNGDMFTGEIVSTIIQENNVSGIIATISRTVMDINRPRKKENAPAIDEYRSAIWEIIDNKDILDEQNKLTQNYLHIALHGMKDNRGVDFEIGTRNGETCCNEILKWFLARLQIVSDKIGVNKYFSGDRSKSFHRNGDPDSSYPGYGNRFHTIQVEICHNLRRNRQKELRDFFAVILLEFDKNFNNNQ